MEFRVSGSEFGVSGLRMTSLGAALTHDFLRNDSRSYSPAARVWDVRVEGCFGERERERYRDRERERM